MTTRMKMFLMLVLGLLLGFGIEHLYQVTADYQFTYDENDYLIFQSDVVWPQTVIDGIALIPGVNASFTTPVSTVIKLNLTALGVNEEQTIEYIKALDYKFANNKYGSVSYPGYPLPQCTFDYGTNQRVGMYVTNGVWVAVQNDTKC